MKRAIKGVRRAAHSEGASLLVWVALVGLIVVVALSRAAFHY